MAGIEKEIGNRSDHGVGGGDVDLWTPYVIKQLLEDGRKVIMFAPNDPENPFNWSLKLKIWLTILGIFQVSENPFNWSLEVFVYVAVIWYNIWTLACAVAPNMPALLGFRVLSGLGGSAALSVTGGMYADIWKDPVVRGSVLLIDKAKRLRAETGDDSFVAPAELEDQTVGNMLKLTLTAAADVIHRSDCGVYGFSPGIAGLAFIPLCIGSSIACLIVILWDEYLLRLGRAPNSIPFSDEYWRLSLAAMGGLAYIVALFWLGWTVNINIHWINVCRERVSSEYYDSECVWAALPVAAQRIYASLGVGWATRCMGFVAIGLGYVPFIFMKYGQQIRGRSKFCMYLKSLETKELAEEETWVASMATLKAASRAVSRAPSLRLHDEENRLTASTLPFPEAPTVTGSEREHASIEEIAELIGKEVKQNYSKGPGG
ncbi:hypothetical protein EV426DRAFT_704995 [Tirmania nivea]|nr:hypothetical protein EV426DRAFT_704995 [Tirmania nivea]